MTYSTTKFEVATSKGLVGDTFTRNVTDGRTDRRRTNFDTKLIYPFFLKKKVGIIKEPTMHDIQFPFISPIMEVIGEQIIAILGKP